LSTCAVAGVCITSVSYEVGANPARMACQRRNRQQRIQANRQCAVQLTEMLDEILVQDLHRNQDYSRGQNAVHSQTGTHGRSGCRETGANPAAQRSAYSEVRSDTDPADPPWPVHARDSMCLFSSNQNQTKHKNADRYLREAADETLIRVHGVLMCGLTILLPSK
jgi:hypothetical protein